MSSAHARPSRASRPLVILLVVAALVSMAAAQPDLTDLVVPSSWTSVREDLLTLSTPDGELRFAPGVGWVEKPDLAAPTRLPDGQLLLPIGTVEALGLAHVSDVRVGHEGTSTRIVLEYRNLPGGTLAATDTQTRLTGVEGWRIAVPFAAFPAQPLLVTDLVTVALHPGDRSSPPEVRVNGAGVKLRAFTLDAPPRFVLDLAPLEGDDIGQADAGAAPTLPGPAAAAQVRIVAPGVHYRTFEAPAGDATSQVHVVDLDLQRADLALATHRDGATVMEFAADAVAAINAGYFDPATLAPIGLRTFGSVLRASPSRGRAVVALGPGGLVIDRSSAHVRVVADGRTVFEGMLEGAGPLSWSTLPGHPVGSRQLGVLLLDASGTVLRNGVGPVVVQPDTLALAYDPSLRAFALLDPGAVVQLEARLRPDVLNAATWAVEAGPLLVREGRKAFAPELEAFERGVRIVDAVTQQAGLGVLPDGTVLFVVAERMVAEDLADLFVALGAEAAMRLDSGGSATLVVDGSVRNRVVTRKVESAIVASTRDEEARAP